MRNAYAPRLRTYTQPTQLPAAGAQLAAHIQPALRTGLMAPAWRLLHVSRRVILDLTRTSIHSSWSSGEVQEGNEGGDEVSGKRGGISTVPEIAVFGISKGGALPCDQDTDAKVTGWRQDMYLPRDVGDNGGSAPGQQRAGRVGLQSGEVRPGLHRGIPRHERPRGQPPSVPVVRHGPRLWLL